LLEHKYFIEGQLFTKKKVSALGHPIGAEEGIPNKLENVETKCRGAEEIRIVPQDGRLGAQTLNSLRFEQGLLATSFLRSTTVHSVALEVAEQSNQNNEGYWHAQQ
jgi:hypothetical protein